SSVMVTLCLTDILADYPDATVVVHNLGGNIPYEVERMDHRCLLDTPNEELPSSRFRNSKVYVDCNSFGPRSIEPAVKLHGAGRTVGGTDGTDFGGDWTRKALKDADIGEEAREKILHGNAAAVLARVNAAQGQRVAACSSCARPITHSPRCGGPGAGGCVWPLEREGSRPLIARCGDW